MRFGVSFMNWGVTNFCSVVVIGGFDVFPTHLGVATAAWYPTDRVTAGRKRFKLWQNITKEHVNTTRENMWKKDTWKKREDNTWKPMKRLTMRRIMHTKTQIAAIENCFFHFGPRCFAKSQTTNLKPRVFFDSIGTTNTRAKSFRSNVGQFAKRDAGTLPDTWESSRTFSCARRLQMVVVWVTKSFKLSAQHFSYYVFVAGMFRQMERRFSVSVASARWRHLGLCCKNCKMGTQLVFSVRERSHNQIWL